MKPNQLFREKFFNIEAKEILVNNGLGDQK